MTNDQLSKQARNLTCIANYLDVITDHLSNVEYQRSKKDDFALRFFMQNGSLEKVLDSLDDINEQIKKISNDICPDD